MKSLLLHGNFDDRIDFYLFTKGLALGDGWSDQSPESDDTWSVVNPETDDTWTTD